MNAALLGGTSSNLSQGSAEAAIEGPVLATWIKGLVKSKRRPTMAELEHKLAQYRSIASAESLPSLGLGLGGR